MKKILLLLLTICTVGAGAQNRFLDFNNGDIHLSSLVDDNLRTMECWFKLDTSIDPSLATIQTLVYRHAPGNGHDFGLYFGQSTSTGAEGRLVFSRRIGSTAYNCVSNNDTWAPNEWHHVAGVIHPSQGMQLYIDGVLQTSTNTTTQPTGNSGANLHIGNFGNNTRFFDGQIDNLAFWSVALSPSQVEDHAAIQCYDYDPSTQTDLEGFYNFETDLSTATLIHDLSPNHRNGNRDFSATTFQTSACFILADPGSDLYENHSVGINNVSKLNIGGTVGNGVRSIECWFKLNEAIDASLPLAQALIYRNSTMGDHDYGFFFGASNWSGRQGRLVFNRSGGSTLNHVISNSNSWAANEWHHVVGVIDPVTGMALYIDGVKQNSTQSTTFAVNSKITATQIGAWGSTSNRYFNGNIDDIRLWSRALTEAEINLNMCGFDPAATPTGLKAYYDFEGTVSTWLFDKSGNNYHATNSPTIATQDIGQSCYKNAYNMTVIPAALHLPGASAFGTIHQAAGHDLRTVECWFKLTNNIDNTLAETQALVFKSTPNSDSNFGLYFGQSDWVGKEGKLVFERKLINASHYVVSDSDSWTADVWHHVAGVIDPTNGMELYIDGVKQTDTEPSTQNTDESGFSLNVGSWSSTTRFFEGDIDEIRLWTRALTQTEINANNCNSFDPSIQTGLRSYYNFDHNTESSNVTDLASSFLFGLHAGATRIGDDPCGIIIHPGVDTISICDNTPYQWIDGSYYHSNINLGVFHTISGGAADGNDTIVTLYLTMGQLPTSIDTQSACGSYTWIDGVTYTASNNTATDTIIGGAVSGCDSLVILNLTIDTNESEMLTASACGSYTWLDGITYTSNNNTATHTVPGATANGCDSIYTLNLTINNNETTTETIAACNSYTWRDGTTYTLSNNTVTHTVTGATANGCDSVYTLNLTINNNEIATETIAACNSYTWRDGTMYTSSNNTATHTVTGATANGCDSLYTLNLTITNDISLTETITACDLYIWRNGTPYFSSANGLTYIVHAATATGCDSIYTLNLTINNNETVTDVVSACGSYTWRDGITYTASTHNLHSHVVIGATTTGCDSTYILDVTINQPTTGIDVQSTCGSYTWLDGQTYTASNNTATHTLVGGALSGCDSIVTLNLTFGNSETQTETIAACNDYTWRDGTTYTSNNNTATHTVFGATANGCDSIYTLQLTINTNETTTETIAACNSYTWRNGTTYTSNNNTATHTIFGATANGCDSIYTLQLTINTNETTTESIAACNSYTWRNGTTYTSSNNTATHTIFGATANGCDSIYTLQLMITTVDVATNVNANVITANATNATYQWLDCDNNNAIITGETSPVYAPDETGNYAVEVTTNGCMATSTCVNIIITSIDRFDEREVKIFPNPTTGNITIESLNQIHSIEILSLTGQSVARYNNTKTIDISHVSSGVYFIKILTVDSRFVIQKLVKE